MSDKNPPDKLKEWREMNKSGVTFSGVFIGFWIGAVTMIIIYSLTGK